MDLWEALLLVGTDPALHAWRDGAVEHWPRSRLLTLAEHQAAGLRARGVDPGTRVACLLTNVPEACAAVMGTWLAGAVVVSAPIISRGQAVDDYVRELDAIGDLVETPLLLAERRFAPFLDKLTRPVVAYEELAADTRFAGTPPASDATALIQFSSGSTRAPRGCVLTPCAIAAQLEMLQSALGLEAERDRGVMWLPLSHDMGLFGGLLMLWAFDVEGLLSSPERFIRSPRTWLDDCADFRATLTLTPALALGLAARAARAAPPRAASPMRACLVGGDSVPREVLEESARVLGPFGLTLEALTPAYGLAEATLGVALAAPGEPARARPSPDGGGAVVSAGRPLDGVDVRVEGAVDDVGEIRIRTPSAASGYFRDEVATRETFVDGEIATHDIGFVADGELHVIGRSDDVIKVGARKVWATEVEASVAGDPAVRQGGCALVDAGGGGPQRLTIVAEPRALDDYGAVARRLARSARRAAGISVHECVFIERGSMPKTPSGKLQRHRVRHMLEADAGNVLRRVALRDS